VLAAGHLKGVAALAVNLGLAFFQDRDGWHGASPKFFPVAGVKIPKTVFAVLNRPSDFCMNPDSVRPETRDFGRDQGMRKILPQAYN
jgi:hypothetical protein